MTEEQMRAIMAESMSQMMVAMHGELLDLRAFVDRRLAEVSVDLTHTFEFVDDTQSQLAGRLEKSEDMMRGVMVDIVDRLTRITQSNGGDSTASSGVELELAVRDAEESADRILGAAERLSAHAAALAVLDNEHVRKIAQAITDDVAELFEATSFHDLAGQRVRGAIRILDEVRTSIAQSAGLPAPQAIKPHGPPPASLGGETLDQSDIDRLFD